MDRYLEVATSRGPGTLVRHDVIEDSDIDLMELYFHSDETTVIAVVGKDRYDECQALGGSFV